MFSSTHVHEPDDSFTTNRKRARFYLHELSALHLESVADIGTPSDFFFLKSVHQAHAGVKLFAVDLYEKACPDYITLVHSFEGLSVDLCTALHVLEHVEDPGAFVGAILKSAKYYVFEVPNCVSVDEVKISSTQPHAQFFNLTSFTRLFDSVGSPATILRRAGRDLPSGRTSLVAYCLPEGVRIEEGGKNAGYFTFWSRLLARQPAVRQ